MRLREFEFSDEDFEALRKLVKQITGINLSDQKRELVYGRLARRLRALQLHSFARLPRAARAGRRPGDRAVLQRDHHQPDIVLPRAAPLRLSARPGARAVANSAAARRLRIWSAGCSTGEEPYSIAMTILEALPDFRRWDVRILATDLDSDVLERGRRGLYAEDRVQESDPAAPHAVFPGARPRGRTVL